MKLFSNTSRFFKGDIDRFILMLQNSVYTYDYMDDWENSMKHYPPKKDFKSKLNMEDVTDTDYKHAKRVWKDFELKSLGNYNDYYVESDTLLVACLKTFKSFCCVMMSIANSFKKDKNRMIYNISNIDILLMIEKTEVKDIILFIDMQKCTINTCKIMIQTKYYLISCIGR